MQKEMTVFMFGKVPVRATRTEDESWFLAADVCAALGIQDANQAARSLDDDEHLIRTVHVSGQRRKTQMINESGLYHLVFISRKPAAKRFRKWVTSEVLPALRKTGKYETVSYRTRMLTNVDAIPARHFSILWELHSLLIWRLESKGHTLPETMLPDSQVGKLFCAYLREQCNEDTEAFPTYKHIFPDGRICYPKAYPNRLLPIFRDFMSLWEKFRLVDYFKQKDPIVIELLSED